MFRQRGSHCANILTDFGRVLTRSTENTEKWDSLLPLPEPYVVPGGRFREVYYWDSYFTMLGLAESGHWDKVADMVLILLMK